MRFTGRGTDSELVCEACIASAGELVDVCAACQARAADGGWSGIVGEPEIAEAASPLAIEQRRIAVALPDALALEPVLGGDRASFVTLCSDGGLYRWGVDDGAICHVAQAPATLDLAAPVTLRVSRDGRYAAVANRRGLHGAVLDLADGRLTQSFVRDGYHEEHCDFSLAFVERAGRTLVIHPPAWNRLDVSDAATGELLTPRGPTSYQDNVAPPHYLDYFHCGLTVSPDQQYIVDNGWVWHPVGVVATWSLERWLGENVWESEDGPSRRALCWRDYAWDLALCWLDDARLAVYGYGQDDEWLLPAASIYDVRSGQLERWFPGPRGAFVFDRVLYATDAETTVWDVARGARLHVHPGELGVYHPTAKLFVTKPTERSAVASTPRGLDADAPWNRGVVRDLARTIAAERTFAELPVLGDALQLAGCTDEEILAHCHAPGEHGDRCWVLDRLGAT